MAGLYWTVFMFISPVVFAIELPLDSDVCANVRCKKPAGSWCVPRDNDGEADYDCVCPESCPEEVDPVCSQYGKQYDNLCLLHQYACSKKKTIELAYKGECIASQKPCKGEELEQFPIRLLDWFLHLKEVNEFGRLNPDINIRMRTAEQRAEIALWKFNLLDRRGDGKLDRRDLKEFRFALMPLEHCSDSFFRVCTDKKTKKITQESWLTCLKVHDEEEFPLFMQEGLDQEPEDDQFIEEDETE